MFQGIVGVLALGVIAIMVRDTVAKGSQGPSVISSIGTATGDFYKSLSG